MNVDHKKIEWSMNPNRICTVVLFIKSFIHSQSEQLDCLNFESRFKIRVISVANNTLLFNSVQDEQTQVCLINITQNHYLLTHSTLLHRLITILIFDTIMNQSGIVIKLL